VASISSAGEREGTIISKYIIGKGKQLKKRSNVSRRREKKKNETLVVSDERKGELRGYRGGEVYALKDRERRGEIFRLEGEYRGSR